MKLPSEKYFISVQTEEDFYYFLSTGMLYELEANAPSTWGEHLKMVDFKKKKEYCERTRSDNYKASLKLEGFDESNQSEDCS